MANIKQTKERKQNGGETRGEVINCAVTPSRVRLKDGFFCPTVYWFMRRVMGHFITSVVINAQN